MHDLATIKRLNAEFQERLDARNKGMNEALNAVNTDWDKLSLTELIKRTYAVSKEFGVVRSPCGYSFLCGYLQGKGVSPSRAADIATEVQEGR